MKTGEGGMKGVMRGGMEEDDVQLAHLIPSLAIPAGSLGIVRSVAKPLSLRELS